MTEKYRLSVSWSTFSCTDAAGKLYENPAMDPARHKQEVGRRLKTAIQALNKTQAQIARDLGSTTQKINNWTRGDHYPDEWFVYRFCNRYGITTDYIYRGLVPGVADPLAGVLYAKEEASREASEAEVGPAPKKP